MAHRCSAGVLAGELEGRLAPSRFERRDAAETRSRGRLRYSEVSSTLRCNPSGAVTRLLLGRSCLARLL